MRTKSPEMFIVERRHKQIGRVLGRQWDGRIVRLPLWTDWASLGPTPSRVLFKLKINKSHLETI